MTLQVSAGNSVSGDTIILPYIAKSNVYDKGIQFKNAMGKKKESSAVKF